MPDLRDAEPTRAAPPRNDALVRVVANRLAEQTSTWNRRPPAAPSRPAWPTDLTAQPQPEGSHPALLPVDPATPIELPRSALAQPGLTAGNFVPEMSQQSTMSSPETHPRGEGDDRSASPVGALASERVGPNPSAARSRSSGSRCGVERFGQRIDPRSTFRSVHNRRRPDSFGDFELEFGFRTCSVASWPDRYRPGSGRRRIVRPAAGCSGASLHLDAGSHDGNSSFGGGSRNGNGCWIPLRNRW